MNPEARLTILFDCCHSGSACELPFVFRPDADGNINLMDTFKKGMGLIRAAQGLIKGGVSREKMSDAKMLLGGATDFFNSLHHLRDGGGGVDDEGLAEEKFSEDWDTEGKDVWMFSGCRDDQTSADATIGGAATGAMSWALLGTLRDNPEQSYEEVSWKRMSCVDGVGADSVTDPEEHPSYAARKVHADPTAELWGTLRSRSKNSRRSSATRHRLIRH